MHHTSSHETVERYLFKAHEGGSLNGESSKSFSFSGHHVFGNHYVGICMQLWSVQVQLAAV